MLREKYNVCINNRFKPSGNLTFSAKVLIIYALALLTLESLHSQEFTFSLQEENELGSLQLASLSMKKLEANYKPKSASKHVPK